MSLRVCGFDLSLTASGIAATHDHNGVPGLLARTVHTRRYVAEGTDHRRLHDVYVDVAAALRCKPHVAAVEGAYVGQNNNTLELAELRGVVTHYLWVRAIPYAVVSPSALKVYATGRGTTRGDNKVTKTEVRERVTATYGHLVHIADADQADAIALLALTLDAYGEPLVVLPDTHRRAIRSVKWPEIETPEVAALAALAGNAGPA